MKNYLLTQKKKSLVFSYLAFFFFLLTNLTFGQITNTYTFSGNWTVPTGVTSITVEAWGAGGAGGGSTANNNGGSGGGGGGYTTGILTVTPGQNIAYTVGTGGIGINGGNGGNGTATTILTLTANGGTGGGANRGPIGIGGTATGGTTNTTGGNGVLGGNRGSAGGDGANGGAGGAGNINGANGINGAAPGGGGSGGEDATTRGGNGARGEIRITYTLPALTNDDCSGAIPLTLNTSCSYSTYNTTNATGSTGVPAPGCASYSGGDVWFSFVVPANGEVTVDTQTGGMTDSGMAWYTGTCGSLTLLECDDDDSVNGLMSSITRTGLTPGATIYVRVWEFGNDNPGTFGICATSPGPCTTPAAQASGFTAGTITSTSFPATFSGTAGSYLVIRSTSATPPSQPVNGVNYTAANINTLGSGLTIVQNGASTTIFGGGLNGNTQYYYYIYAYNNTGCTGGPLYNTSGPLTGNAITCPATPSPVNTTSTLSSINFSWPSSLGGGANAVTYELQVTTNAGYTANVPGSPFTINDPTTSLNITGLTANTTYYYRIRANNGCWSSYTTGIATTGYCSYSTSNSTYWISNFNTTGGSTNINRNSNYTAGGYANYSATDIVSQVQGSPFNFSVTMNSSSHGINIYVDWNNDLDFNDAGELVYASGTYVPSATGTITIPVTASIGNHRMRVVSNYFSTNPAACGSNTYTEAEDYTINVTAPAPCSGTPTAGTTSVFPNTTWPGATYVVSATGFSVASNLSFQWQYSTDAGATWTNAGAATTAYADYTATAPASGDVHWQLVVTCTNSGQSTTSVIDVFVTMEVSDVVTGCPNVVSGGFGLNGADPAPIDCTAASTCVDLEATYLDLGNTSSYIVEPIVYNPPFAFNGLANPVSVNTDDVWSPIINLPFDFCFYGNTYTQCTIGSNGILTFDTSRAGGSSGYSFNDNIPISGHGQLVENAIFGVFHDINPGISGEVGWELITLASGCRALVASWYNVPMFSNNSILYTGMMVLYENSNIIEVYVQEKRIDNYDVSPWNGGNAIIGIQNSTGTLASVAPGRNGLDPNWTATNEAWRFVPNGSSITTIQWYEGSGTSGPVVGTTDVITVCPGATTTYTAEITYTLCDGSTIVETDETTVTVNGAKTWNGSVNTNWNNANNWTPASVPTITDCVLIPVTANDPIISGASYQAYGLNLTIDSGATLTINSNNSLTIDSWINIATGGDLVIQNAASLVQINNNTNTGIIHMDRDAVTSSPYDYVYWSSPVDNFSVDAITPTSSHKYQWIPTINNSGAYAGNFGNWSAASGAMNVGQGYIVRGSSGISTFEGVPNNGIINTPIERSTYAGADYPGPTATMVTENDDNWNLLGNPYPSAIDAIDFMTTNTNIDGFVKIWTHGTLPSSAIVDPFYNSYAYNYTPSDYITFNSSGTSSGPGVFGGYIAAGQGFFVLMNHSSASTSETVTFDNSMRSDTFDNSQFFKTSNTVEKNRIWLDLIDANNTNVRALVGYITDATNERDRLFDAITDKKLNFNLYSFTNNEKMTIQGRTLPFNRFDLVPMGVAVPADGNYKIAIGALDGLFEDNSQEIYIEDLQTGIIHNLRETPYSFTATKGNTDNRFVLRYTNNSLSNEDFSNGNTVTVYSNDNLIISSTLLDIKSVRIYDILGRSLANFESVDNKILTATGVQKNNNAIIVQITLTNGNVINKKVIY